MTSIFHVLSHSNIPKRLRKVSWVVKSAVPATSCRPGGTVGGPELRGGTGACAIASSPPGDSGYAMGCQFGETSPIISMEIPIEQR